nr:MATH and LRR domain-containing protein PFE0570w-like isoform X2 [Onthophagus taurus]
MCDSTLLLIKDKIINTDAIIKLLSDKNTQINRLKRQLKFLYKKYLAQIKELEICNLKETTNQSYIDEKTLLEKYTELEGIHQDYVNVSTIKYQNICKELEECKSSKGVTTIKTIKKCNKCKEEVENNRVLKRQITNLKQNIEQLTKTLESKNGRNLNDFKYSSEYKLLKQHHTTEIENLMSEHMMELDKVETKFKSEINIYQDRIVSLEAQDMIYKDKIDELKLELNETKICLAEKNKVKPENHINNEIKGGLYELLSECDLELPKVDDQLKTRLDQSSQTDEISFYNNNTNPIENVDVASLFGDNFSDVLSDHQEDFMEFKDLDAKTDCNELLRVPLEPLEEEKEDLNDENLDVWRCIQEMKEIPEPLSSLSSSENEDETTTPKKKNVFNKRIKLKRLAQENRRKFIANIKKDVFKSLVKHVGKMLKKSTDKENKSNSTKSKKMSKQFKNKRKLEMLRWTALREISSTDSDVSCTSKSKIKMRKLERYKHLNVNNKEEYAKFCAKFNTMTDFYNSLSGNENKINDNGNIGEESCWSGQDSGFGKSDIECGKTEKCIKNENDKKINIQSIKILKQDKLQSKLASSKEIVHDDSIKNQKTKKKSTIIGENQFLHNSKEELLFGECSSSENDNVSFDTKDLVATLEVSSDSLETTSLKELSQSDSFENNNDNFEAVPKTVNEIVATKTMENDLVQKSTENDDTNSFKDSDNKKQTISRRYSVRINKLKHQPTKKCGEEIIENEKIDKKLLTNSILEIISTEESIKLGTPSQLSNKNGCSSSESDNEICNKTENNCNSTKKSTIIEEIQFSQNCKHNSKEELLFGECLSSENDNVSFDTKEFVATRKVSSDSLEPTSFKELSQSDLFENNNLNNNIVETKTIENDLVNEITTLETSISKSTGNDTNSFKDSDNKKQTISRRYSARINKLKHQPSKKCGEEIIENEKIDKKLLTNSILELISTEESIKLSTPSQLSNKNGCSSSESDNEICNKTENTCNSTKKSTIIKEIQYLQNYKHNSKEELLFGKCSSSENDNVSFDTKEFVATRKVSSDSLETTSLKELSQTDSFENNNLNNNNNFEAVSKTVKEIVETKTIENDLVNKITTLTTSISKSTENDDTNSFKDSDNKKQTITRRYSPRINKLKHQAIKRCRKEIIENKKIHNKLLTNSILELISTEESIEPSTSSQLSNRNGCSESDTNEISHKTQNNSDELSKLELPNSQIELSSIKLPSVINGGDVPVRPMKIRKANEKVTNLKRKLDEPVTKRTSEPANKLKKVKDNFVKRFNKDDMVKEVIKMEMERKLEKACFKRPVKRPLCTPMSPPHSVDFEFTPPKIIPLKKVGQLHEGVCKKLLKKLIQFPGESVILQEIFDKFSSQKQNYIIRLIIAEVLIDTSKSDNKYTPPAPLLTPVQRTLLGLTIKLQESFPDILTEMLFSLERSILIETSLDGLISTTRFYTGICKLKKELHRMRRMIGDVFFTLNNLAIPFLYTVLSTWTEILPLEAESHDNMLVKVLIQIINMKNCKPGYCLTTLKGLLQNYYGYPKERWKSEDVFNETFTKFKENPSKFLEFALLILFKNHPNKWVYEQMRIHLKPLLNDSADNHVKKAIVVLISNTLPQFGSDNCQYVQEIKTWLNLNLNSVV